MLCLPPHGGKYLGYISVDTILTYLFLKASIIKLTDSYSFNSTTSKTSETTTQASSPQQIAPVPMANIIDVMSLILNVISDVVLSSIVYSILVTCLRDFVKAVAKGFVQPDYICTTSCPETTYSLLVICLYGCFKAAAKGFLQPDYSLTTFCPETTFDVWCDNIGDMIIVVLCAIRLYVWSKNCLRIFCRWLNPLNAAASLQVTNHQHQHQLQHQDQH